MKHNHHFHDFLLFQGGACLTCGKNKKGHPAVDSEGRCKEKPMEGISESEALEFEDLSTEEQEELQAVYEQSLKHYENSNPSSELLNPHQQVVQPNDGKVPCPKCGMRMHKNSLKRHKDRCKAPTPIVDGNKREACPLCGKVLLSKNIQKHQNSNACKVSYYKMIFDIMDGCIVVRNSRLHNGPTYVYFQALRKQHRSSQVRVHFRVQR